MIAATTRCSCTTMEPNPTMLPGASAAFSRFERRPRWIDTGGPGSTESNSIGAPPPNNSLKHWAITSIFDPGRSPPPTTRGPWQDLRLTRRAAPQLLLVSPAIKPQSNEELPASAGQFPATTAGSSIARGR